MDRTDLRQMSRGELQREVIRLRALVEREEAVTAERSLTRMTAPGFAVAWATASPVGRVTTERIDRGARAVARIARGA